MANIVIDAREISTSTGRYVERLLHYLQSATDTHKYTVLLKEKDFARWESRNPRFTKYLCPYKEFTFGEQIGFKKMLNSLKPDLVHFTMTQQPILYRGKTVTTVHDLTTTRFSNPTKNKFIFWFKQQLYKLVTIVVAKKSSALIAPSEFVKNDLAKYAHIKPEKISVTYESADPIDEPAEPIKELQTKQFLLYVGRAQPHKNITLLVDALAILKKDHPELLLVLAGKKDRLHELLLSYARVKDLQDSIYLTNFVSEGQLKWLYRSCKVYVFPSLSEGFGLPGLEAMRHHAPVASSDATCLPEIYGDAAAYFNPRDPYDIARTINRVLTDLDYRKSLIRLGSEQVKKYSWEKMAVQTLDIYNRALRK